MVLPLIIAGGLLVVVLMFRDQIKGFVDDQRTKGNDPELQAKQSKIDERGALENTQAFFLGEQGLTDLKTRTQENEARVNQFLTDSQTNLNTISANAKTSIDQSIGAVNTSLVASQQNLEKFAKKAQTDIAKSINDTGKNIDTGIKATQTAIDTSIRETQTSIDSSIKGTQDFFGNLFNNPFGGQQQSKTVITKTPTSTTPPPVTTSPKNNFFDLSFLTPNTSLKATAQTEKTTDEVMTLTATTQREGRKRFGQ